MKQSSKPFLPSKNQLMGCLGSVLLVILAIFGVFVGSIIVRYGSPEMKVLSLAIPAAVFLPIWAIRFYRKKNPLATTQASDVAIRQEPDKASHQLSAGKKVMSKTTRSLLWFLALVIFLGILLIVFAQISG